MIKMKRMKIEIMSTCPSCRTLNKFEEMPKDMVEVHCNGFNCDTVYYAVPKGE